MAGTTTSRGRPKGSGIDDSAWMGAIANMIADNPEMRPTTAIKALGVSNPSIIRRLRDKFNARTPSDSDDDDDSAKTGTKVRRDHAPSLAAAPLNGPRDDIRKSERSNTEPPASAAPRRKPQAVSLEDVTASPEPAFALISAGATMMNVFAAQQAELLRGWSQNPWLNVWWQQQVLLSELVMRTLVVERRSHVGVATNR